jgi:hypothetical protein
MSDTPTGLFCRRHDCKHHGKGDLCAHKDPRIHIDRYNSVCHSYEEVLPDAVIQRVVRAFFPKDVIPWYEIENYTCVDDLMEAIDGGYVVSIGEAKTYTLTKAGRKLCDRLTGD